MDVILNKIEARLRESGILMEQFEKIYPKITEYFMPLSITGVSARTYLHWKSKGLIPDSQTNEGQREWVRLNLIDYVWIKIIQVMRDFGMPLETIKQTKELLFENILAVLVPDKEDYLNFLRTESDVDPEKIQSISELIDLASDAMENNPEEFDVHTTIIGSMISDLLIKNDRGSVIITKSGKEFDVSFFSYKTLDDFKNIVLPLLESPHIQIPIRKLIEDFFDDPKSDKFVDSFELLNFKEKKVIDAIRKKDFKQIIIKQDQAEESIIIELERDGDILDQKAKDVKRLLGLNEYSEVTIKYRNDKHIYFKNTTRL
ncbi:MerR family transcriptional regulator [Crocinitomicaceae bacterium]|nr:MerR family transcriptional regulator [Crocinitomicaceae bacterium]